MPLWTQTSPFCTVRSEALASPLSAPGHVLTTAQPGLAAWACCRRRPDGAAAHRVVHFQEEIGCGP